MKRLNVNISDEQMLILKMIHANYSISITKMISSAIDEWIGRNIVENRYDVLRSMEKKYIKKSSGV